MKESEILKAQTLGDWAYLAIEQHSEKTFEYESDVLKDRDPEALHQMRVGMRRLRSAVTGFAVALDLPKAAEEEKIAKIARQLGMLRDLDVLLETLERDCKPALPTAEQDALDTAVKYLRKDRRKVLQVVQTTLKHNRYKKLKQALKDWLKQPAYQEIASMPIQDVLPDLLMPQVSRLFLHAGWMVGDKLEETEIPVPEEFQYKVLNRELSAHGPVLHSLRKQVKRVRYQMNLFSDLYGSTYDAYVKDMKEIQEVLGEIQDSQVLEEVLKETLDSEIESSLPALAEHIGKTRQKAWQQWKPLQERYLNPSVRQAFHLQLLQPLPQRVNGQVGTQSESADKAMDI